MIATMLLALLIAASITLPPLLATLVIGVVLPLLVDLVTKSAASAGVKRVTLGILAAISGTLVNFTTSAGTIVPIEAIVESIVVFLVAWVAFRTKPVKAAADVVQEKTANFGVSGRTL